MSLFKRRKSTIANAKGKNVMPDYQSEYSGWSAVEFKSSRFLERFLDSYDRKTAREVKELEFDVYSGDYNKFELDQVELIENLNYDKQLLAHLESNYHIKQKMKGRIRELEESNRLIDMEIVFFKEVVKK